MTRKVHAKNMEALAERGLAAADLKPEGGRNALCEFEPHSFRQK